MSDVMLIVISTLFSMGAIAAASPWFLIVIPIILYAYGVVMNYYRASARELKRLQAISLSPIQHRLVETAEGLVCIRAFGLQHHETKQLYAALDRANTVNYVQRMSNRWMAIRVDLLGSFMMAIACALAALAVAPGLNKFMGS